MLLAHPVALSQGVRRPEGSSADRQQTACRAACSHNQSASRIRQQAQRRWHERRTACTCAAAAGSDGGGGASGGGPALPQAPPHPSRLRLGADIPIALRPYTVDDGAEGCTFLLVVPDIDAVMEMYIQAGQADRDPYWCEPWPSAIAMSEQLLRRPELVRGKRACELGCGLGLAGLAAAVAGASEVVLLDREPLALQCALLNAAINGLPPVVAAAATAADAPSSSRSSGGGSGGGGVQVPSLESLLPFLAAEDVERLQQHQARLAQQQQRRQQAPAAGTAEGAAAAAAAPAAAAAGLGAVRAELFDWSQPVTLAPHDVCLVCDCLYEAFSVQPVAEVAPRLLRRRAGARLLLADPPDRARHNRECFLDFLTEESGEFLVEEAVETAVRTWEASKASWRSVPIALMALRRAEPGDTVGVKLARRGDAA